ncbi:hypothetical protein CNMCM5793_005862 [Aspergillus hiratsukae]|uniref:HNH nuclease domain-containing protein n=1 Tax=Aspergillus hiratsukae TaxID=1194566 RepID=A0A8H6UGR3_9EURO|nr:hypothetical protein CNMCM5793_005862 [Aspergillus hiratsukae]KAF7172470.1 hypothetical protein CNMCM6106_006666 [Aspergillus hiratsukae]
MELAVSGWTFVQAVARLEAAREGVREEEEAAVERVRGTGVLLYRRGYVVDGQRRAFFAGSCANCVWNNKASTCSFYIDKGRGWDQHFDMPKVEELSGTLEDTPSSSKPRKTENSRSKAAKENSMGKRAADESTSLFWSALRNFWSEEKIKAWRKEVPGPDGTETCANLITLCSNAHGLWEKGRFAIQPLELAEDEVRKVLR